MSEKILNLLAARHANDVFVTECKSGPTWSASHLRMDAWAMKKSWSKPLVCAYEIKMSRSDFLRDDKWPNYLPYCNELYFVCPYKLIQPEEMGEGVGLVWTSKNIGRLYIKRRAAWRDVEIPEDLWRYILMSRVAITRETCRQSKAEFWRAWMKRKEINREFGWNVSSAISKRIDEEILMVDVENKRLKKQMEAYDRVIQVLKDLDIDPDGWGEYYAQQASSRLERISNVLPPNLIKSLKNIAADITGILHALEREGLS